MARGLLALALALCLSAPAMSQEAVSEGQAAFEAGNYAAAEEIWRREAEAGVPEALLGLGFLHDLGLGMVRDPYIAFRFYAEAAEAGLPEAAFNIGVMLDSGTGVQRSAEAAAAWYGRAAAAGHARARYNLGLLYAAGEGVPQNGDLARYWLESAATDISAAGERLAGLAPVAEDTRSFAAPTPLTGAVTETGAVLVWSAPPGPEGLPYRVQVMLESGVREAETQASALEIPLAETPRAWRVLRVEGESYAASPWRPLEGGETWTEPRGQVAFVVGRFDPRAETLAARLAAPLDAGGLAVETRRISVPPDTVAVRYGYRPDADLAARVAGFLPGLTAANAQFDGRRGLAPGEVEVALRFRPEPRDQSAR